MEGEGKRKPDFVVKTVRKVNDKDNWTQIGVAYVNGKSETISCYLNALPIGDKLVLMKPLEAEKKPEPRYSPFGQKGLAA